MAAEDDLKVKTDDQLRSSWRPEARAVQPALPVGDQPAREASRVRVVRRTIARIRTLQTARPRDAAKA